MHKFTVEQGIAIQQTQLNEWNTVLKPEAYAALEAYAIRNNDKAKDGYDICRGEELRYFVQEYAIKVTRN